jgi:hypothetical protein
LLWTLIIDLECKSFELDLEWMDAADLFRFLASSSWGQRDVGRGQFLEHGHEQVELGLAKISLIWNDDRNRALEKKTGGVRL